MKKLLTIFLAILMLVSFTACSSKVENAGSTDAGNALETSKPEEKPVEEKVPSEETNMEENTDKENSVKPEESVKPGEKPQDAEKPQKPVETPAEKEPEQKPAETPAEKVPEQTPVETPAPVATTLGNTLLADFKSKAAGMDVLAIAESLLQNPAIKFFGGAMPVEEGLLSGFDNAEIKGFKSGAMFAPMIGSIAFVGYVFELSDGVDASAFIANLKSNANRRWNICVEADEMVTGSVGNKVFFVMCPTSLEE